jgi:DNA polymerase III sliding clamp (beta) subunit (PCNA family)
MNPPDWNCCTAGQLWHYVTWHLEKAGISTVLVGGAAVSVHTGGVHRTTNLDLVPDDFQRGKIPDVLRRLKFVTRRTRDFVHPECPHLSIRFPMGPVEIDGESPIAPDEIEIEGRRLHLLSPTDCVKDRLASYFHWRSRPFFDQAVLICQHKPGWVDLGQIERWCEAEGTVAIFQELRHLLADSGRSRVVAKSAENTDTGRHNSEGIRPMILVFATELQSARRFLTRLRFEQLQSPVLTHVLATVEKGAITLAVTDGVHWLESRIPNATAPDANVRFLIPAKALEDGARSGRGKTVQLDFSDGPGKPLLQVKVMGGSTHTRTIYPTESVAEFPDRPASPKGSVTTVPKETLHAVQAVGICASKDAIRYPKIGGVFFSPESGGVVVATDGRHLASVPARVPDREFILPNSAVHVLEHPEFTSRDVEIVMSENPGDRLVEFRAGIHILIAKTVSESYPEYRAVIPDHLPITVTVPEAQRIPLITRLRSLKGKQQYVRLTWDKPGHMTLTHHDTNITPVNFETPVEIDGDPPAVSFLPRFLANALTLGLTMRLLDHETPCIVSDPSGKFCVIVAQRTVEDSMGLD